MSSTLEARLARQETAEDVRSVFAAYARAVDAQDPQALRPVFAEDVVLTAGAASFAGLDAVIGFFSEYWSSYPAVRRHFVTNVDVSPRSSSGADATASFLFV